MGKRGRENPCEICDHYHKQEETCGVCGHHVPVSVSVSVENESAFPSEILKDFLYLGSYDHASRIQVLKTLGISHILNVVPASKNLYSSTFIYHHLQNDESSFDDEIQFIEQCAKDNARVLVHCMSGRSRSPSTVIAYLMKCKGWRLEQSLEWVKERRAQVILTPDAKQRLLEFEQRLVESSKAVEAQNSPALFTSNFQLEGPDIIRLEKIVL